MKLKHYYHIYAGGAWVNPVTEHLSAMVDSGLAEHLDEFNVGIVGPKANREQVIKYLTESACEFNVVVESEKGWEQETLDKLYEASVSSPPFKVLYAHTKGAAHPSQVATTWRQDMTEGVVGFWETAVELLDDHDAVGIIWLRDRKIFGGNFWWANSSFISELGYPHRNTRFGAEDWLRHHHGIDSLHYKKMRVVDLSPGYRLGSSRRQLVKTSNPKIFKKSFVSSGQIITVKFLNKIAAYKPGQIIDFPDGVFLRAIINGGKAAVIEPLGWTPEKADETARLNKEQGNA